MATASHVHHPAHRLYLLTLVLLGLTVILGFIAVFVPWVMKDIAPGKRAWAYPFKSCIEETMSPVNAESCMDNDLFDNGSGAGFPVTAGNNQCRGFVLATIAFVFISVIGGVLVLLSLAYILDQLWTRPTCVAMGAQVGLILVCVTAFLAWIMFICYAETTCAPNSVYPVQGYSYGFICYIFASALSLGAVITGFMALKTLKTFVPQPKDQGSDEEAFVPAPVPAAVPEFQQRVPDYPVYDPEPVAPQATPQTQPPSFNGYNSMY